MSTEAYPYPILGHGDDFIDVDFQFAMRFPEEDLKPGDLLEIEIDFSLSDEAIETLIESGKASFGLEIACSGTSRRSCILTEDAGTISLNTSEYFGRVELSPRVFITQFVPDFSSENFNPEFGDSTFDLSPGDFVAATSDEIIYLDFKKLKFDALIKVERLDQHPPWQYNFNLEGELIVIAMGSKFHDYWIEAKNDPGARPSLIMSVYKDCMVAALEELVRSQGEAEHSWAIGLLDKLEEKKIALPTTVDFGLLNPIAQQLMEDKGIRKAVKS